MSYYTPTPAGRQGSSASPPSGASRVGSDGADDMLGVALAYSARGFSVVPQDPGEKKPRVRWKRFQVEPPTVRHCAIGSSSDRSTP
jgi:hypothetical protein